MRCLRALRLGRVGLDGVFGYFGVQRASMRMRGGAARLLQQWRCSYFGRVGGAAFCNSCWSSALLAAGGSAISVVSAGPRFAIHVGLVHFLAGGVQCCILVFFLLVAFGRYARCGAGFGFVRFWPGIVLWRAMSTDDDVNLSTIDFWQLMNI